jgi:regulatory protein YycI of two-component signal transduction system YycFG
VDWSRAKTYLILTFLVLDILLGYQFYTARQQAQEYVQSFSDQLQELKDVLREHRMASQTDVPKETPVMKFLQVHHPKKPVREIAADMLHEVQLVEDDKSKGRMKFTTAEGEFGVTGDGYLTLHFLPPLRLNEEHPAKMASAVLGAVKPYVWNGELYHEDLVAKDGNTIWFAQYFGKYPLFSASLEVRLQNGEVMSYHQKALEIGEQEETSGQRVLSAIAAVRAVAESLDPKLLPAPGEELTIQDIRLGYYSRNYDDADVWYLAPVWRVVTEPKVFYVNAFTGQVEKSN